MTSQIETGHAKNVANFKRMITFCVSYQTDYSPSKQALQVANLQVQLSNAENVLANVKTTERAFNNATNLRMDAFSPLKKLATRVVNALEATEATKETIKDAVSINRKIQGKRANKKEVQEEKPVDVNATPPADKKISASQQSYDQLIEHTAKLLQLVSTEVSYNPNEVDLKVATLQSVLSNLNAANEAVINAYTQWSNTRIERDQLLYNPVNGIVKTAADIKKYVKSVYTATGPKYKQISSLEFREVK